MAKTQNEEWDLWYPQAGATGLPFARSRVDAGAEVILVHSAPPILNVTVRDSSGHTVARAENLEATADTPIARLTRQGEQLSRTDIWPSTEDIGRLVLLPGGEAATLLQWWNAPDHSEWRWQIELYNHR